MAYRAQYPDPVKELVKRKYPLCRSRADREALTRECDALMRQLMPDVDHPPMTLQKLYNLASRLEATRGHANTHVDWVGEGESGGYDAKTDATRLLLRDDPDTLQWTEGDLRYLREHWGQTWIEQIAYMLNRTEIAVAYKAREIGLRNVPKYWDISKVSAWLGLTEKEITGLLGPKGLEIHECCDAEGRPAITLVSTTSLARVLLQNALWKTLVDKRNADTFFIKDIIESCAAMQDGEATYEPNVWVSHGHTCLNPFAEACFGWFYDGYESEKERMPGWDLDPRDLHKASGIGTDQWMPEHRTEGAALRHRQATIPVRVAA